MSGRITMWGASELLMCFFARTSEPPPSFWLAAIKDVAPTPYVSGLELDEPTNDDYGRVEIPNELAYWMNDSQPQEVANVIAAQFITALSDWGEIRYWALTNAQVGGDCYFVGDLLNPVMIATGDQLVMQEGDLSVSLGPFFLTEEE